jgi:hypothetical protein
MVVSVVEANPEALKLWRHRARGAFREARSREVSLIMSSIISDKPQNCLMAYGSQTSDAALSGCSKRPGGGP